MNDMNDLFDQPQQSDNTPALIVADGRVMADSREVAAKFEKRHDNVLRAIQNLECSSEFKALNFEAFKIKDLTGESTSHYAMTRDGFTFLVMGFTGAKAAAWKELYIKAFNIMESRQDAPQPALPDFANPAVAARAWADQHDRAAQAEAALSEARADQQALARIAEADGSLCVTDAAKALQMRPKEMFAYLRANRWIYRRAGAGHDCAYQAKLVDGLLEHKVTTVTRADGSEKVTEQVRVTAKGLTRLAKVLKPVAMAV